MSPTTARASATHGYCTRYVALHPLRSAAPVTWRCTRYVALHPLCGAAPEQKGCNAYGSGALPLGTSESVVGVCRGDCVAQRGGLPRHHCVWIGGHDRPREGAADPRYCCVWIGVQGTSRWRRTRYVALHPLCGGAPEQKGCNAYRSGVAPSSTKKVAVVCWMTMLGSLLNGAART